MRLLDKDPDLRFQTAADLRSTCRRRTISSSDFVSINPSVTPTKVGGRSRWLLAAGAAMALVAGCVVFLLPPAAPRVLGISQITRDGGQKEYFVSDGLRLYYETGDSNSTSRFFQVSIKGGDPVAMPWLNGMIPFDITKDGSQMLLGQQTGGLNQGRLLWLANTVGGAPRKVGVYTAFDARFSPNGDEILYTSAEGLVIAHVDGSNPRLLTKLPGFVRGLAWSPDGRLIRFISGDETAPALWEVRADGSHLHELFAKTRAETQTPAAPLPTGVEHGNWTPDGKFFVFSAKEPRPDLWVTPSRANWRPEWKMFGSSPTRLTNGPLMADIPVAAPDGKRLFFRGRLDKGELVRYDSALNEWRPYLSGLPATQVDYSRDGKWITYVNHRDHCVWRCASDGTNCSQLTSPPVFAVAPFFSPDASQIIFFDSPAVENHSRVYLVPAAGGTVRQLTHGEAGPEGDDGGAWGPDGVSVVFSAHGGDHPTSQPDTHLPLRVVNVKTGKMRVLPGSEGLWSVRWSPDGRYIAAMNSPQTLLFLYDPATHAKRQITDLAASWPQWSRDSKFIYFGNNGFWYRVSISDRKLARLAPLDKLKMADWTLGWVGVTPDGDLIATADAGSSEIYALDWDRR